ncbi:hypothetical protein FACS1894172_03060 [Spirochaetia bacterium]|nr:hypothetical protein FACS1894172_03060 [Spirochaetia bacterium]
MSNLSMPTFTDEFSLLKFAHSILTYNFPQDDLKKAFLLVLYENMIRMGIVFDLHSEFAEIVFNGNIPNHTSDIDIDNAVKLLMKKYKTSKESFSPRITYKYLMLLALAYILKLGDIRYDAPRFANLYTRLKINKKQQFLLENYIRILETGNVPELLSFFKDTDLYKSAVTIQPLNVFINNEYNFYNLPRRNISVFSTMSAGKSTFINSLLGHDYLPSKNEACTAKIASIANTGYIDYCLGYASMKGKPVFCGNVDQKKMEEWNNDHEVSRIILEGNLDRISSEKTVTIIHDTPGINYSGNAEHKKITIDHLINSKPEVIICLLDATQMFTTDSSEALEDLKIANESIKARILFVLNKADSYDAKKESLNETIADTLAAFTEKGFSSPAIIPVSSRAARLFKMALHERINFTENEIDDFVHYLRFFSRPENDFSRLAASVPDEIHRNNEYKASGKNEITVEGKKYEREQITQALFKTGIPVIENLLNTQTEAA